MSAAAPIIGAVAGGLLSSKGGGSTTTVQQADPWEGIQPALRTLYDSAVQNFQGPGPQYYPGQTVAPQSPVTEQAQQGIYSLATQGNPLLDAAQQQAGATLSGQYFAANPATQGLYDMAGRDFLATNPAMQDLYSLAGRDFLSSTPGMGGLYATAQGDYLNANPYLDSMFDAASSAVSRNFSSNVQPGIASMFSGAGRFGSGQMAEGLGQAQQQYGQTLNDLATQIYGGNYAAERARQQAAQAQLGQFGLAGQGLQQQALGQLGQFGLAGQGLQQQALGELGTQFGRERAFQSQAMNFAPQLSQADYFDMAQLANLGGAQDAYAQAVLSGDIDRFNFGQNAPNQELAFLSSILSGAPAGLMGSTGSVSQPASPWMGALGGFQLGRSLFGNTGDARGFMPIEFGTGSAFGNQDLGLFL